MDRIAKAKKTERQHLFTEVSSRLHLSPFVIEKDFWVSWLLEKIFSDTYLQTCLCFKGGTSLSKAFHLIERFSEDIDLILSQHLVLQEGEVLIQPSNSKQDKFNKIIEARAGTFISHDLKERLTALIAPLCTVESDINDAHTLYVTYPRVFDDAYIQPTIKLEIGPLALWNPNEKYEITSFVGTALKELNLSSSFIPTVKPERTFWEKVTILHHEHHRPEGSTTPLRYSRHYYDVYKIAQSNVKETAFNNLALLNEVVAFKKRFYPRNWARYDEATPGTLKLLPSQHNMNILEADYTNMQNMIYGEAPSWPILMDALQRLEEEINSL